MFHKVMAALGDNFDVNSSQDATAGGATLRLPPGFGVVGVDGSGSPTKIMPNSGFIAVINNTEPSSGSITLNDTDGNLVATIDPAEAAFCVHIGQAAGETNQHWRAVIISSPAV
jgi:hypothetical protein